ncbi:MAG: hypothetical protein DRQ89_08475 [Epsilonproteobacteria bacterium]|nr:MAG: hypothetical protein DRQ89_08475 [Campylobacterota bacterium]
MKKLAVIIASVSTIFLVGCFGGGGGYTPTKYDYAISFVDNLTFNPAAFGNFWLEKTYTYQGGGWIVVEADDGFDYAIDIYSYVGDYYAYDLDYFDDYAVDVWGVGGGYWEDINGNLYEEGTGSEKDLEKVAAQMEKLQVEAVGEGIALKFGLSVERGQKMARIAKNWKKASKTRSMTDRDADALAKELFGFDLNEGMKAIKEFKNGDGESLTQLIEKAAEVNGVTPEHLNQLLMETMQ